MALGCVNHYQPVHVEKKKLLNVLMLQQYGKRMGSSNIVWLEGIDKQILLTNIFFSTVVVKGKKEWDKSAK